MQNGPAVVIVGAGFGGLGMAIQLKKAGFHDFVIVEKSSDLGGTWRDNHYPGCACDVPSHLYSFSFELKPDWSRLFAPQQEIWDYMRHCARKYNLEKHLRYDGKVESLEWDDAAFRWKVSMANGCGYTTKVVISALGPLHIPRYPDVPGIERFTGTSFHSAEWDHSYDFTGRRVAVIGTGASAIQFVPRIAERAELLHVFQRTAPWIQPKPDVGIPVQLRKVLGLPGASRTLRNALYWMLEARSVGFTVHPRLSKPMENMARRHLAKQIPDPRLRAKLTPDYRIGCKRILLSMDYYPTLTRPNVHLVTDRIAEVTKTGIVTEGGRNHAVDAIVYGTGFKVVDALAEQHIVGRRGLKIQEAWADGIEAHRGVTVPGFPNFFMLLGPNSGLGHNSMIFMLETQIQHILGCLRLLSREKGRAIEVRAPVMRRYNDRIQRRLRKAVWNEGGCRSWYLDENGVNRTLWPGFTFEYWARTRKVKPSDYVIT